MTDAGQVPEGIALTRARAARVYHHDLGEPERFAGWAGVARAS